jgi:very-short-patch-repair endonuclease
MGGRRTIGIKNRTRRAVSVASGRAGSGRPLHLRTASPGLDWKTRFRIIASKASRKNRNPRVYSTSETPIREELIRLGYAEGSSFVHEQKIFGYFGKNGQPVYYWLDFYLPALNLGIEADGDVWHHFSDIQERDRTRDALLMEIHGLRVVRLDSFAVRRRKRLWRRLVKIVEKRKRELSYARALERTKEE